MASRPNNVDGDVTLFYRCVQGMMKSWTALQLAVSHSFAGPHSEEKAQWLIGVVESFFNENADLEPYEVEDFLEQIMSNEFNIIAEDDSIKQISIELCKLYQLWSKEQFNEMKEHISKLPCINLGECVSMHQAESVEENEQIENLHDNTENMQIENKVEQSSNIPSNVDSDGWVHVTHKKKH